MPGEAAWDRAWGLLFYLVWRPVSGPFNKPAGGAFAGHFFRVDRLVLYRLDYPGGYSMADILLYRRAGNGWRVNAGIAVNRLGGQSIVTATA